MMSLAECFSNVIDLILRLFTRGDVFARVYARAAALSRRFYARAVRFRVCLRGRIWRMGDAAAPLTLQTSRSPLRRARRVRHSRV